MPLHAALVTAWHTPSDVLEAASPTQSEYRLRISEPVDVATRALLRASREQPCLYSSGHRYIDGRFNPASDANVPTLNDDDGGQMSAQTTRGDMRRRDDQKFVRRARGDYRWRFFVWTGRFGFLRSSSAISDAVFSSKVSASACSDIAMRWISVRMRRICFFVFGFFLVFGFIAKSPA